MGPPDPILDEKFEGFDTKVLMVKNTFCMKANTGKTRRVKALVVTGNKDGLAGFAVGKSKDGRVALRKSKNKAAQRLRYFKLHDGHTITHDFYSRYGCLRVYAYKKPPGYGIVAHRCIKAICDTIGIKDIYVKTEGTPKNYLHVTRAFFLGLCNQKTFQELADEKKLHVVELKPETDFFPKVMASPADGKVRTVKQIPTDEITDFRMYINEGKVVETLPKQYPNVTRTEGYLKFLQGYHFKRNRQNVRVYLKAKYGQMDSFLTVREREERAKRKAAMALAPEAEPEKGAATA
jgi:small subunit ribosomal protein S5